MMYKIKSRIWIEHNNQVLIGEGRFQLLKAIDKTGSLTKAAKELGLSYKKAWHLIDSVNKASKEPITINTTGGKGGGGVQLTNYGKTLVVAFEEINQNCWTFLENELEKIKYL